MSTLHFSKITTATPQQFLAAVTDFGPGRQEIFPNSHDGDLVVHERGEHSADVTEGSYGIWERLRYDWSDPNKIVMTTTDSNIWGGHSGHTYVLTALPDGTTRVDVDVVREGKNLGGRLIGAGVSLLGDRFLGKGLERTIHAVEAHNAQARPPSVGESTP
jgi:hypothetical protein